MSQPVTISRRHQVLAVASPTFSAMTAAAVTLVAVVPALRASLTAYAVILSLSLLANVTCAPWPRGDEARASRAAWLAFALLAALRGVGVAMAVAAPTLATLRAQLVAGALAQLMLVGAPVILARGAVVSLLGLALCAGVGAMIDPATPLGVVMVAWTSLTLVRWVQCEEFLLRALPVTGVGRLARWRHPGPAWLVTLVEMVANSRVMQLLLEPLPVPEMRSDITGVVYVNYLVEADRLAPLVPEGLVLQRLGPQGRYALLTFLTYRHSHFGFTFLGPLRRWLPPLIQTNWRVHVRDPRTGREGIRFITNAADRTVPALAARLFSEGMPMHVLARASLTRDDDGTVKLALDPGHGSAPDATATLRPARADLGVYRDGRWEGAWRDCFDDFESFLRYCLPQDRAMDAQPWRGRVSRQEIHLGIPVQDCVALEGEVRSEAARALVGDATPVCFLVPSVAFCFRVEAYDPLPVTSPGP
ncbi:MAG: DUF2071 domain-containing protein [Polyangiales bacterium]